MIFGRSRFTHIYSSSLIRTLDSALGFLFRCLILPWMRSRKGYVITSVSAAEESPAYKSPHTVQQAAQKPEAVEPHLRHARPNAVAGAERRCF